MSDLVGAILQGPFFFMLELLAAMLVIALPLQKREKYFTRAAAVAAMIIAYWMLLVIIGPLLEDTGMSLTQGVSTGSEIFALAMTTINCVLLFFVCLFAPLMLLYRLQVWEALYCAACAYLMEHIAYCVRTLCAVFLPDVWIRSGAPVYWIITVLVYAINAILLTRKMITDGRLSAQAKDSLSLTVTTLTIVLIMSAAATLWGFEQIHAVYALFCCGAILYAQVKHQQQVKTLTELSLQQQMWSMQRTQYEMSRESIEAINRKCHDLKHQVAALRHIQDPARQNEVLDSLESSVMIYDAMVETGNPILDTILTEKSLVCSNHDIALSVIADGQALSFMDPVDLYTMVGNALDNAVEAVMKLPEEERLIRLRLREQAGLVLFQIENPCEGEVLISDGLPRTSKPDAENHGFGVRSIRDIAEKYQGLMKLEQKDGLFVLRLTFPVYAQQ